MPRVELLRFFERRFAPAEATLEDRRRRSFVALGLLLSLPFIAAFGVDDLLRGHWTEAGVVLGLVTFLAGTLIVLARLRNVMRLFRLGVVLILGLLFYELSIGGGEGFAFFWFYCVPILVLSLFGRREGTGWALGGLAVAGLVLASADAELYEPSYVWRFLVTYLLVVIFSYGLESARYRCHAQLLAEKAAVEDALAQVKTLRGLLPICTRCKSVRDDRGFWQQIELYVDRHSDAEFSHGLCPACAAKLYPDLLGETETE